MVDTEDTKYILIRHIKGLYTTRIEGLAYMQKSSLIRKVGAPLVFCLVRYLVMLTYLMLGLFQQDFTCYSAIACVWKEKVLLQNSTKIVRKINQPQDNFTKDLYFLFIWFCQCISFSLKRLLKYFRPVCFSC